MRIRCGNQTQKIWCETRVEVNSTECSRGKLNKMNQEVRNLIYKKMYKTDRN